MPPSRTTSRQLRRAPSQGAVPPAPPEDPPAPQRRRDQEPERAVTRARRSARQRQLPRAHPARARLRRACPHRAAPRGARALLPRHCAAVARRQAVGAPARGVPPQDAGRTLSELLERGLVRQSTGGFDHPEVMLNHVALELDEQGLDGRRQAAQRHAEAAVKVQAESQKRQAKANSDGELSAPSSASCTSGSGLKPKGARSSAPPLGLTRNGLAVELLVELHVEDRLPGADRARPRARGPRPRRAARSSSIG